MHLVIVRIMISLLRTCWRQDRKEQNINNDIIQRVNNIIKLHFNYYHDVIYFQSITLYLLQFGAIKVPPTNLVISCEHVHGHHADGESHSSHNNFPRMGGHKQAVDSEKSRQHDEGVLQSLTADDKSKEQKTPDKQDYSDRTMSYKCYSFTHYIACMKSCTKNITNTIHLWKKHLQ